MLSKCLKTSKILQGALWFKAIIQTLPVFPISRISVEYVERERKRFELVVRMNPEFMYRLCNLAW